MERKASWLRLLPEHRLPPGAPLGGGGSLIAGERGTAPDVGRCIPLRLGSARAFELPPPNLFI